MMQSFQANAVSPVDNDGNSNRKENTMSSSNTIFQHWLGTQGVITGTLANLAGSGASKKK